jgi:hypothetical protein
LKVVLNSEILKSQNYMEIIKKNFKTFAFMSEHFSEIYLKK